MLLFISLRLIFFFRIILIRILRYLYLRLSWICRRTWFINRNQNLYFTTSCINYSLLLWFSIRISLLWCLLLLFILDTLNLLLTHLNIIMLNHLLIHLLLLLLYKTKIIYLTMHINPLLFCNIIIYNRDILLLILFDISLVMIFEQIICINFHTIIIFIWLTFNIIIINITLRVLIKIFFIIIIILSFFIFIHF